MSLWEQVKGQDEIKKYFTQVIDGRELSHAYLIEMPRGENRLKLALAAAERIQCLTHNSCGSCTSCIAAESGNHPDIIRIYHEKKDIISVDEIRKQLVEDMEIKPYRSEHKIYIVDDADLMNPQAQNAILKTLEEPPAYGVILMLAENRNRFLPTILSRCLYIKARENPDWRSGFTKEQTDIVFQFLRRSPYLRTYEMQQIAEYFQKEDLSYMQWFAVMRVWFRDVLVLKTTGKAAQLMLPEERHSLQEMADKLTYEELNQIWESLEKSEIRCGAYAKPDLVLELFFQDLKGYMIKIEAAEE